MDHQDLPRRVLISRKNGGLLLEYPSPPTIDPDQIVKRGFILAEQLDKSTPDKMLRRCTLERTTHSSPLAQMRSVSGVKVVGHRLGQQRDRLSRPHADPG